MTFVAAAIGGAAVLGGALLSSSASKSAANTQAQSESDALAQNRDIFNTQVGLQEPWRQAGIAGLGKLNALLGLNPQPGGATFGTSAAPTPSFGGLPAQTLTRGPDGVFSPETFNEQAYLAANSDVAKYIQQHPGTTALQHYQTFGKNEGRLLAPAAPGTVESDTDIWRRLAGQYTDANGNVNSDALNPAVWAEAARQKAAQQQQQQQQPAVAAGTPAPPPPANDFTAPASLTQPFSQSDFATDPAPKAAPFTPAALPTFNPATVMTDDPGYQFRLDQGRQALDRAASASGGLGSGKYLKDAITYNQGQAAQEYGNTFNRFQVTRTNAVNDNKDAMGVYSLNRANSLQDFQSAYDRFQTNRANVLNPLLTVSGFGQQAANQTSAAAQNFGNQATAAITASGNARAAGQVGSANAINGGIGQGISLYQQNQLLSRFPAYGTGAGSYYQGGAGTVGDFPVSYYG